MMTAMFSVACSRTGLEVEPAPVDAAVETGLPFPPDCLDDELPRPITPQTSPVGLRVIDSTPCEGWSDPPRRETWTTPPPGAPHELWRTTGDPQMWGEPVVSIDGSIWIAEYHPESSVSDYFTIATYDRSGSLRWRSRPLCDLLPSLSVGPDAVGIVGGTTNWRAAGANNDWSTSQTIFLRLDPDGQLLDAWASPDGLSSAFPVRGGPILFSGRPWGVLASCRGQRPLWSRTIVQPATGSCVLGITTPEVIPQPNGTAWVSFYLDGDPTQLSADGSIVQTLPRSEPAPSNALPRARVAGTQDPALVLVVEGTLDGYCGDWPTERAALWQGGQLLGAVDVAIPTTGLPGAGFRLAPDDSIWSTKQFNWVARFVDRKLAWKREDLVPMTGTSTSHWAADGSYLDLFYDDARHTTFLARVEPDGSVAWSIDVSQKEAFGQPFAVAPDGVVYAIVIDRLVAVQTDFAPARRTGEVELPNGYGE
ncbi:MAG TPA: hypothetical protein VLM85_30715 [Polyangiaceae bacterium]|nr:hypothetical protein [Polyangiaceae bacterium]